MEKSNPLKLFIELANYDQDLNKIRSNIDNINSEIKSLNKDLSEINRELENSKNDLHDAQKNVHEHELAMKILDEKLQEQQNLLDKITSQKEYNAVKSAISQIKQEQHDYESTLIEEWSKLDNSKINHKKIEDQFAEKVSDFKNQISEKEKNIQELNQEIDGKMDKRNEFLSALPKEWLDKYESMHSRVSDPIVQLINGACGACFQIASPQVIIDLKHRKLIQCNGCYRFLFIEKEDKPVEQSN